jgi:hypothetical protein
MTGYIDFTINQGASFVYTISLSDSVTGSAINIAGYSFQSQLRKSYQSQNVSANLTCTIIDAANGTLNLSLSAAETANLKAMTYVYDLKSNVGSIVDRVIQGLVIVNPNVTR